ncbi:MAG TPA: hypothetical protein VNQ56_15855 [Pseudolabrys sp.]|nr:hypothetical protein [Pseudolabrys sp.]
MILAGLAAAALLVAPADAAPRKRADSRTDVRAATPDRTVVRWQDENGRSRTRIIVQKRSFLDAGTNVQRGERKFTDYVIPPGYSATGIIDNTAMNREKETMPGPFDLPSRNNPRQW